MQSEMRDALAALVVSALVAALVCWAVDDAAQVRAHREAAIPRAGNFGVRDIAGREDAWDPTTFRSAREYAELWLSAAPRAAARVRRLAPEDAFFTDTAVVHVRCSDVPFNKHPSYPLLPEAYYAFASEQVARARCRRVVFLACYDHKPSAHAATECPRITSRIAQWMARHLAGTGIEVDASAVCVPIDASIAMMRGARVLVSTGGSFSFLVGVTKGREFVTPSLCGRKRPQHAELASLVHWSMWERFDYVAGTSYVSEP